MTRKHYKQLEITDNFMFCKVLGTNEDLCRRFVSCILGKPIRKIAYQKREESIDITPENRGIRMDVYLADDEGTVYDLEMQNADEGDLPERIRYYQGMIDLHRIERGQSYVVLPHSVIIFICQFDLPGLALPLYHFENRCRENPEYILPDRTEKILANLNADSGSLDSDLRALYNYLKKKNATNDLTRDLDRAVIQARNHEQWEVEYMYWEAYKMRVAKKLEDAEAKGREEGIAEGRAEGIAEGMAVVLDILSKLRDGCSVESLVDSGMPADLVQKAIVFLDAGK